MMKLTTPATASEPQAAEAPPVTTSTRWTTALGKVVMSTPPVRLEFTMRWPSNRTRVRLMPRLRRLSRFAPAVARRGRTLRDAEGGRRGIDLGQLPHIIGDVGVGVALQFRCIYDRHRRRRRETADRNARTADNDRFHILGRLLCLRAWNNRVNMAVAEQPSISFCTRLFMQFPLGCVFCFSRVVLSAPEERCDPRSPILN